MTTPDQSHHQNSEPVLPVQEVVEFDYETTRAADITPDARLKLEAWGIPAEKIDELGVLGAQYEYADCLGKMERIAAQGAYRVEVDGQAGVLLSDFFDPDDRSGGQCAEIADKVMRDLHQSGWLESVNTEARAVGKPELHAFSVEGHARDFFRSKDDAHTWVSLGLDGSAVDDMVTVDGSMLEVSSQGANGYHAINARQDPESNTRRNALALRLGVLQYDDRSMSTDTRDPVALGLTTDRSSAMFLAFLEDQSAGQAGTIRPLVQLQAPGGGTPAVCVRIPGHGLAWGDQGGFTTPETRAEAERVYLEAEKIKITSDDQAALAASQRTHTISFRTA